jgi:RimJ/RimL family protein N-acetyltransferase
VDADDSRRIDVPLCGATGTGKSSVAWDQICIKTTRLVLRTPRPEDAPALHGLFADPVVMHGLNRDPVSDLDGTHEMIEGGIEAWLSDGVGPFILETAVDGRAVGWAGVMIFDTRGWTPSSWTRAGHHAQPELGWALMRTQWGCGYATEAAAAIRDWAYQSLPIDLLVSLISPANVRSQHVARRIGATPSETISPVDTMRETVVWRHSPVV